MWMNRLYERRRDEGFTLIELVVAVAVMGIIAVALTGVVIQYLKVTTSTETRLNESSDMQFVSTYWQNDVSSLGQRNFAPADPDPVAPTQSVWVGSFNGGCGSSIASGQPVVTFSWNGYTIGASNPANAWNQTTQRVAYVAVPNGSQYVLKRVWCGTGAVPTLTIAHNVTSWTVKCDGGACGASLPNVVTLKMHVQDKSSGITTTGNDITLTGERRQTS